MFIEYDVCVCQSTTSWFQKVPEIQVSQPHQSWSERTENTNQCECLCEAACHVTRRVRGVCRRTRVPIHSAIFIKRLGFFTWLSQYEVSPCFVLVWCSYLSWRKKENESLVSTRTSPMNVFTCKSWLFLLTLLFAHVSWSYIIWTLLMFYVCVC